MVINEYILSIQKSYYKKFTFNSKLNIYRHKNCNIWIKGNCMKISVEYLVQ